MDVSGIASGALAAVLPYLTDPTVLMSIIIVASVLASLMGKLSWKITGMVLIIGAVYSKLAEVFGPEAAAAIVVSDIVSFTIGQLLQAFKQKFIYQPMRSAISEEKW